MYIPAHFAAGPDAVRHLLATPGAANLVTMTAGGLLATLLPFVYEPSVGEHGALHAHVARNNPQWPPRPLPARRWRSSRARTPTFRRPGTRPKPSTDGWCPPGTTRTAHVYGQLVIHDDAGWLARHVRRLTDLHEAGTEQPWTVDDAPERFIAGQLRAIVGIELLITRIEAKEKLSQNRSDADAAGVVAGLRSSGQEASAAAVERVLAQRTPES